MNNSITRKHFLGLVSATISGSLSLATQRTSPLGSISHAGSTATFAMQYARPLESVAYSFRAKYGWRITLEEAPLLYAGDIVDLTRDPSVGIRALRPKEHYLEFSYPLGPGGSAPENPESVIHTALAAYHKAKMPGTYKVVRDHDYFHIIAVTQRNERKRESIAVNPLDKIVNIAGDNRSPEVILEELVTKIETLSGYPIMLFINPFSRGEQPRIETDFVSQPARDVLKALIDETGLHRVWYLLYAIRQKGYFLNIL